MKKLRFFKSRTTFLLWLGLLFIVAIGLTATIYLFSYTLGGHQGGLCTLSSSWHCETATHSEWSSLLGIPLSGWGLGFYASSLLLLATLPRFTYRVKKKGYTFLLLLFFLACCASFPLGYINLFVLQASCPICSLLHILNVFLFATALLFTLKELNALSHILHLLPSSFFSLSGALFLLPFLLILTFSWFQYRQHSRTPVKSQVISSQDLMNAPIRGISSAPINIVVFSDFQCTFCKHLAWNLDTVWRSYPGQISIRFLHFPLASHEHARLASSAACCAQEQGHFWCMHDALYKTLGAAPLSQELFVTIARNLELNTDNFDSCINSHQTQNHIEEDMALGRKYGVGGTPTFFVNGKKVEGYIDLPPLQEMIKQELKQQR
ncbi:thioredoxin domain-containing protein [Simkania negevensis]|uniref:Thioredoxin domain-containing protein n=1 Tax=Simkania negevensis TaxID=83561 RepID=A0ABS3ASS1_9BACT|nr:thioredoxin domain-containing protein [Simkania negevensis]